MTVEKPKNHNFKDLTNQIFGRLTVIEYAGKDSHGHTRWLCECNCPSKNKCFCLGCNLKKGQTQSCGCRHNEMASLRNRTHHESETLLFYIWIGIIARCTNQNNEAYHKYGGRGITICERWLTSYPNFKTDIGQRPSSSHSVERVDNNGNYSCGHCDQCIKNEWLANCKWATKMEQANNRRTNRILEHNGKSQTSAQWSRETGISQGLIHARLKLGWTIHETLSTPVRGRSR